MKQNKYVVLGTGAPVREHAKDIYLLKRQGYQVMAFQEAYPHCLGLGVSPDLWTWSDPNSAIPGLEAMLRYKGSENLPKIVLPKFVTLSVDGFRQYCGTSPLARREGAWDDYLAMLEAVPHDTFEATTTKKLRQNSLMGEEVELRFELSTVIYGSVPFDSETVDGTKFMWGLESKFSQCVLPMMHHLGAEKVVVCGFGMKGSRFFSDDVRMPFNDSTQSSSAHEIPLSFIKKWTDEWKRWHKMTIATLETPEEGHLSQIMPIVTIVEGSNRSTAHTLQEWRDMKSEIVKSEFAPSDEIKLLKDLIAKKMSNG